MGFLGKLSLTPIFLVLWLAPVNAEQAQEFNRLNWVEISQNRLSTQIMFDFNEPVHFSHEVVKDKHQLQLTFPGMNLHSFNPQHVFAKLEQLKAKGFIKSIEIFEQKGTVPRVVLAIEFAAFRNEKEVATKIVEQKKNRFLIKWNTLEHPYRLIVDIFIKEDLDQITNKNAVLLHAMNDVAPYDIAVSESHGKTCSATPRIVLDAGHGGKDLGAKGHFGLIEKNIALDIAKQTHKMLKKKGYQSLLIRSEDKDISLLERSQLAYQLKADLLVSIHVNSSGDRSDRAWGIETYYLNGDELVYRKGTTGFLFINTPKDPELIKRLDLHIQTSVNQSKKLACQIQKTLLNKLSASKIATNDRGIHQEKFRVLLRANIPAALVEVGFLTNHKEASRLCQQTYRTLIANGICDGISSYVAQDSK